MNFGKVYRVIRVKKFGNPATYRKFSQNRMFMKAGTSLLVFLFFVSCASGKQKMYTASTPADTLVRKFLDIPLADSVDFIRWKLVLSDTHYALRCTYGIGKKNTNGFINGGKTISISGTIKKEKNKFFLYNGDNYLQVLVLNDDLLHIVNADQSLVVGNGGWSYTLNNMTPLGIEQINISAKPVLFNDSMALIEQFESRVTSLTLDDNEKYLAAGTYNGIVWVINLNTNAAVCNKALHLSSVNDLKFAMVDKDQLQLASAGADQTIKLMDISAILQKNYNQDILTLKGHSKWIYALYYTPDSRWLFSTGEDNKVIAWKPTMKDIYETLSNK